MMENLSKCSKRYWRQFAVALIGVAVVLAGCNEEELIDLVEPPQDLDDGWGVGVVERDIRVRVDDSVETLIYLPTEEVGVVADGPFPVVLLLHGGITKSYQYAWLARHFARRGFVVVAPSHPFDLAIFAMGNGGDVVDAIDRSSERSGDLLEGRIADTPAIATGHSLGGVVASKTWLRSPERFSHLLLLHAIPDDADADELAEARPDDHRVFAIAGGRDGRISAEDIAEELELFADEVPLAVVEGQNHFQLIDGPEPSRFANDDVAAIEEGPGRKLLIETIDLFVDSYLDDEAPDFADSQRWPEGVVDYQTFSEDS